MPPLPLTRAEQGRVAGAVAKLRMRNFYVERDASNAVDGLVRLQRPGLGLWQTVGAGPIHAVFRQDGTLGGDHIVVSGPAAWRVPATGAPVQLGTMADERAQIVGGASRVLLCNGGVAYSYDGTTWRRIVMPDGFPVQSVAFVAGFFLLSVLGTQRVYYMEPGEDDPDALSFFEAEALPDANVSLAVVGDEVWILGERSEQVWVPVGDLDAPFQPAGGRTYQNGCLGRDAVVSVDNGLFYVGRDATVMLAAGVPQIISTPDVSEAIRLSPASSLRAWAYRIDNHLFYVLSMLRATWVYDTATQEWSRWQSWQRDGWLAHLGVDDVAGSAETGALWRLEPGRSNDDGLPMERLIAGGLEVVGVPVRCDSVSLRMSVGNSVLSTSRAVPGIWDDSTIWDDRAIWRETVTYLQPTANSPRLEMRWSDDEGNLWTDWRAVDLGAQGQYRTPVVFRRLGLMRRPGRIFEFRATDDAEVRISHAMMNEAVN